MPSRQHERMKSGAFYLHQWLSLDLASLSRIRRFVNFAKYALRMPTGVTAEPLKIGKIPAEWLMPAGVKSNKKSPILLYFHGGGYLVGSLDSHRGLVARIAEELGWPALHVDYRLAPEHTFPAALEDAEAVWKWLLAQGYDPLKIAIAGDSAGGGLILSAMVKMKELGLPLPFAAVCLSPWVDLTFSGHSAVAFAKHDPIIIVPQVHRWALAYAGKHELEHPEISPLYADLSGLPPTLIQASDQEVLTDDAMRLKDVMEEAGVAVTLQIWKETLHVWQLFWRTVPEAEEAVVAIARFLRQPQPITPAQTRQ
ncbi:MAG: alpha/beta hydrolase [Bacteroidia bacterium]|nr:alpha/beta hydrolase [Bacteroidia bacterium]